MTNLLLKLFLVGATASIGDAFAPPVSSSPGLTKIPMTFRSQSRRQTLIPKMSPIEASNLVVADRDYGELIKNTLIVLAFGGGLIPATISANQAMFKTLSGKSAELDAEETDVKAGESLDPTIGQTAFRKYVGDSGASGPDLPFSSLLFAKDRIPVADIVAVLGRIESVDKIVDWKNLPSTKLPNVSTTAPPMWLPRRAFKAIIRQKKFLGWPDDPKTGKPVGGEELKAAESARVSKQGALISDAALDAVFDSWSWGANIATPDKVQNTLREFKPSATEVNLGAFIGSAVRGRSTTAFAAVTFIVIQVLALGSLFVVPLLNFFFDIDIQLSP